MLNTIVIYNTVIHKNNVIIIILYQLKNKFDKLTLLDRTLCIT
jgi:hypothetical protein